MTYALRYFKFVPVPDRTLLDHVELGCYESKDVPWVPREGEFVRFRDPNPPDGYGGRRPTNHNETIGYVKNVVTMVYGTSTTIEVYLSDFVES
jgi:hypothetical protein